MLQEGKHLDIQKKSYSYGKIWDLLNDEEKVYIKNLYPIFLKFKNYTEFITYLYSTQDNTFPNWIQNGYYDEKTFNELCEYHKDIKFETQQDPHKLPHQRNKILHTNLDKFCLANGLDENYFNSIINFLNQIALKIVKKEYGIDLDINILSAPQLTMYNDGDYITLHNDGPISNRLCACLIYLTPEEFYKIGNGGELVLKDEREHVDLVYPILGNYAVIDFSENNAYHAVHKVMGDFNRFAYLNFITKQ